VPSGHGHLQRREVEVVASGRGAAARTQQVSCWLPGDGGCVAGESVVAPAVESVVAPAVESVVGRAG
jgi:hypothetical protein